MVIHGVRIGYATPNTMMDSSSMIKKGFKGDATLLRPTFMAGVPLILDRIYKVINSGLAKKGEGFERLFKFCYEYRKMAVAGGEETPIMDLVVFLLDILIPASRDDDGVGIVGREPDGGNPVL